MENNILETLILFLSFSCLMALIANWIRIPHTIALVLAGLAMAMTRFTPDLMISRQMTFKLLLPPLLFHGALHMDLERLKNNAATISLLAVLGVLICVVLTGTLLHFWWGIDYRYGFLFAALITPTDPVSVLTILKRMRAPERLQLILEGESLFNDGMGVVLFTIIASVVFNGHPFQPAYSIERFLIVISESILLGGVLGFLAYKILSKIDNHLIEVSLTIILAFGANLLAEHFELSGILAVVVSGVIIGNFGRMLSMSEKTNKTLKGFWDVFNFMINSFIFLMIGIELHVVTVDMIGSLWLPSLAAIAATLIGRAAAVYPFVALRNLIWGNDLPGSWAHIFCWGGLKGAIPLALVAGLEPFEYRSVFLTAAFSVVLFSLIVQGLTLRPLIQALGLNQKEA